MAKQYASGLRREDQVVATQFGRNQVTVHAQLNEDNAGLPDVVLSARKPEQRTGGYSINLSSLTSQELDLFLEIVQMAAALARPLCEYRDKHVEENREELLGDFRSRVYRPLPVVVFNKRALAKYDAQLFRGHTQPVERFADLFRRDVGVSEGGSGLDEREPADSKTFNIEPPLEFDPGVR